MIDPQHNHFPPARKFRTQLIITVLFILSISSGAPARQSPEPNPVLFPVPLELRQNVEFWKLIYAKYASNFVLLHDAEDLMIIYRVIDFNDLYANPDKISNRNKWRRIEKIKKRYKSDLLRLANKLYKKQKLTKHERDLATLFGNQANYKRIRRAAKNLRGQQGLKNEFRAGLERSGLYLAHIIKIFEKHGLPVELAMLPHVESSFNFKAYSKYGAAGIWQFTRSTGRAFMKINYDIDERSDPIIATEAAAKLLKKNYQDLRTWPLAITAYNHGRAGMKRAKRKHGSDIGRIIKHYRSRTFKFASRNFYAEFIAAHSVATDYQSYFGPVSFRQPIKYVTFKTKKYYSAKSICKAFNISLNELKNFNPALRRPVLRGQRRIPKRYVLRIPDRAYIDENALWAAIAPEEQFEQQVFSDYYRVRRGDNLSAIARRTRSSVSKLMAYNDLSSAHRIYVGQIIKIPDRRQNMSAKPSKPGISSMTALAAAPKADAVIETVKTTAKSRHLSSGSGYFKLADGLSTPGQYIAPPNMRAEFVAREATKMILVPQQEPLVEANESIAALEFVPQPPSEWITVEPEETIGHFADWLEISARELRKINRIPYSQPIHVGQKLKLTYRKIEPEEFQRRRFQYQSSIEEDFFSTFSVDTVITHEVKRGQNIWSITRSIYDVPLWLVMKYNPDSNLQELHIGDQIKIPTLVERIDRESD